MSDKPKCPPFVNLIFDDEMNLVGHPSSSTGYVWLPGSHGRQCIEYIPRHVADQQAREAVRQALEAERAAQHREQGE